MSTDMVVGLLFLAVSCLWLSNARRIHMADQREAGAVTSLREYIANVINYKRTGFQYRVIRNGFFFFCDNYC